jgi:hypothetical protein
VDQFFDLLELTDTLAFEFSAACLEEGGKRPFTVQSTTNLAELIDMVAIRLKNHPSNVALRYRLSTESLKDRTLITNDDELKHFVERLRPFYVHQRTINGKPSRARLKQVSVIFDDAKTPEKATSAKGKVSNISLMIFQHCYQSLTFLEF